MDPGSHSGRELTALPERAAGSLAELGLSHDGTSAHTCTVDGYKRIVRHMLHVMVSGRKQTTEMFKTNDAISHQPNDSHDIDSI